MIVFSQSIVPQENPTTFTGRPLLRIKRTLPANSPNTNIHSFPQRPKAPPQRQPIQHDIDVQTWLAYEDGALALQTAKAIALGWIREHFGVCPDRADDRASFAETVKGPTTVSVVDIPVPLSWSCRVTHVEYGVSWKLETTLSAAAGRPCCFRLSLSGRDALHRPVRAFHVPGLVAEVARKVGMAAPGPQPMGHVPIYVSTPTQVERLKATLLAPRRRCPVLAVSGTMAEEDGEFNSALGGSRELERLAGRLAGACTVVGISERASFDLTAAYGRELSAYLGAVRLYLPGFLGADSAPYDHPLFVRDRIVAWAGGAAGFVEHLATLVLSESSAAAQSHGTPGYDSLEALASLAGLVPDRPVTKRPLPSARPIKAVGAPSREQRQPTRQSEAKRQVKTSTLDGLQDWAEANLKGAVHVADRAYKNARKTKSARGPDIREALCLLRDHYVPMRRSGGADARAAFEREATERGLRLSQVRKAEAGTSVDARDYLVDVDGRTVEMTHKINSGTCRDERRQLWIYFGWDDVGARAVVGWLPTHMRTRLT